MNWEELLHRRGVPGEFKLDRVRELARRMDIVLDRNFFHVAGTNGKGSVCAMLDSGFRRLKKKTGVYTSPHLVSLWERIRIDGEKISEEKAKKIYQLMAADIDEISSGGQESYVSFFEALTVLALFYFQEEETDIAILETGLGGRLDATNILQTKYTFITSIGLDHEDYLGDSLESIAQEKAGILRPNVPLILGPMRKEPRKVIVDRAKKLNSPIFFADDFLQTAKKLQLDHLAGSEQQLNLATMLAFSKAYHWEANEREEFWLGVQETRWPGRWEKVIWYGKTIYFDCTHNRDGLPFLEKNLKKLSRKTFFVTSMLGLRRAEALLSSLWHFAKGFQLIGLDEPRALTEKSLRQLIPSTFSGPIGWTEEKDLEHFFETCQEDLFVVTGSIHLVGAVAKALHLEKKLHL